MQDGVNGPDNPHTSMKILLDWWMEEGNYSKYRGKHNDGVKKKEFCDALAAKMTKETTSTRDGRNVKSKIEHIERTWKEAHEFATSATGAGLLASDEGTFTEKVRGKCPFYYDLLEIMQDRASTAPKVTNYELEDLEEEENDPMVDVEEDDDSQMGESFRQPASVIIADTTSVASAASSATKRTQDTTTTASASKSKKARSSGPRRSPTHLDDDISTSIAEANQAASIRFAEMQRHNKALETLEKAKFDLEQRREEREQRRLDLDSWKSKSEQLDYQVKLITKYHELKANFGWTDSQILRHFPNMREVIENEQAEQGTLS